MADSAEAALDALYDQVRATFTGRVSVASVLNIATYTMAAVEKLGGMSGPQKKDSVVHVIARLVGELPADQEDREAIQAAVRLLLPSIIDTIVSATKGQIDINANQSKKLGCCG